jgi:hypothetical protein
LAASRGLARLIRKLIENGANPNLQTTSSKFLKIKRTKTEKEVAANKIIIAQHLVRGQRVFVSSGQGSMGFSKNQWGVQGSVF